MVRLLLGLLLVGLSANCALAAPDWDSLVKDAYRRASHGAKLKYVDGLLCGRSLNYVVFAADGSRMDLSLERARYESLFQKAMKARLDTKIVKTAVVKDRLEALVQQYLVLDMVDESSNEPFCLRITSQSIDLWGFHQGRFEKLATKVLSQRFSKDPVLIEGSSPFKKEPPSSPRPKVQPTP